MNATASQEKKVPKLRFSGFSSAWKDTTLGKEAIFHDGKRVPLMQADREKKDGPYRYYGASGVIDHIDEFLFDGEYVLLGEDGANIVDRSSRLAFLVRGKFWVNNHAHVLEANGSPYFLAEYLESLRYEKYNTGTAQPKLNSAVCKKIPLRVPEIEEQQKIASFLGSVDAWLDNLRKQKAALETYKRGMMQKIFTKQVRFKDEKGKEYGEWQLVELGGLLDYKQPTRYIVESTEYNDAYKVPVLTAGKTFILGYTNESEGVYEDVPVIIFDDFTTAPRYVDFPFKVKSSAMKILVAKPGVVLRYVYAAMSTINYEIGGHGRHIYTETRSTDKEKESILDQIDFELELTVRDIINFDYIIQLIAGLKNVTSDSVRAKKTDEILKVFDRDVQLRKKKDLVRKFIEENLPRVGRSEDVEAAFSEFWSSERSSNLRQISEQEHISTEEIEALVGEYLYTNRLPSSEEVIEKLSERPALMEYKKVADRIKAAIANLVDVFEW